MTKILIMDDDPNFRNIVYNILKPHGYTLFKAETGREAIDVVLKESPELALLDMRLPDMDGLEVLAELLKINPDIKCIVVSGSCSEETALKTLEMGALYYINKPFKNEEVLRAVSEAKKAIPEKKESPSITVPVAAFKGVAVKAGLIVGGLAALIICALSVRWFIAQRSVHEEYSISYANPSGMCWIESDLWVSDWVTGNIYHHAKDKKNNKLSIETVYKTHNLQPTGLAFDGDYLWSCNPVEKRIYRHAPESPDNIVNYIETPMLNASGLYVDGKDLWITDTEAGKIFKYKTNVENASVEVYESPTRNPCGIFKEGGYFFIGDYKTGRIFKVSPGNFAAIEMYELPGFEQGKDKLVGMTWDGKSVWLCYDGVPKIFCYQFKEMKKRSLI